jgi:hypothetical protein
MHGAGFAWLIRLIRTSRAQSASGIWEAVRLLIVVSWLLILIHASAIAAWGLFYLWEDCMPDIESAFYFSGVTYTTVGYGDLLLPQEWRLLAPIEALTGILMCGLSAGLFFGIVSRLLAGQPPQRR